MEPSEIILGNAFYEAGNYPAAKRKAEEALNVSPADDSAWTLLYLCTDKVESSDVTRKLLKRWLEAVPDSPLALETLAIDAIFSGGIGNRSKANALVEAYLAKHPENKDVHIVLRCFYELIFGDRKKAVELANAIDGGNTEIVDLLILQGWVNYRSDRHDKAFGFAKQAVKIDPESASAWRLLAVSAFRELRFNEARRAAKTASRLAPYTRGMRTIKIASLFGWFPPFFLSSLIVLLIYRTVAILPFNGIARFLASISVASFITFYTVRFILYITSSSAFSSGVFHVSFAVIMLAVGWLLIPEVFLAYDDAEVDLDRKKRRRSVKLKKY